MLSTHLADQVALSTFKIRPTIEFDSGNPKSGCTRALILSIGDNYMKRAERSHEPIIRCRTVNPFKQCEINAVFCAILLDPK
jgi:hypothetical protein